MAVAIPLRSGARSQSEGALTAALYRQHAGELLRFAWHRLGRLEDAEDAVQATFLSAHRVLAEGERVREPRAWLFRILRNECLTRIAMTKRRGVHEELGEWHADGRSSVAEQMESRDEFDVAVALLATLPEQQREALVLREWLGMSAIETADVLDVTPQGVDALVYRARKSLVGLDDVAEESTCGEVRQALADAKINNRVRAHLLSCRSCRAAARRLHAPEEMAAANGMLPLESIAARLGESIPGFAMAGGAVAAASGGVAAVGIVSSIAAGTTVKVVATVAVGAVVATGVAREAPAIREAIVPAGKVQEQSVPAAKQPTSADGTKRISAPPSGGASAASDQPQQAVAAAVAVGAAATQDAPAPADGAAAAPAAPVPADAASDVSGAPGAAPTADAGSDSAPVTAEPARGGGSTPPAAAPAVPAKPSVVPPPASDGGKRAAEAAAEQERRQAEQAKRAAEAAAEKAKRAAEAAAEKAKKAAEAAAEQAKKAAEAAAEKAQQAGQGAIAAPRPTTTPAKPDTGKGQGSKDESGKGAPAKTETPKAEAPKGAPAKTEAPKAEAPKGDAPKTDVAKPEAAKPPVVPVATAPPVVPTEPARQSGKDRDKSQDRDKREDRNS